MAHRKTARTAFGAVLGLALMGASALAWGDRTPARTTYLTFSGPVRLPGVTLPGGRYIFELAEPGMNTDIVRVLAADRRSVYLTAFTQLVPRPDALPSGRAVTFREAPRGVAAAVDAWFPEGDPMGHQFIYGNR